MKLTVPSIASTGASDVPQWAHALLASGGRLDEAKAFSIESKHNPRVTRILGSPELAMAIKANVPAMSLNDGTVGEVLADWEGSSAAFYTSLRTESVFLRLFDSGMRRLPMRTRVGVITTDATAYLRREGRALRLNRFAFAGADMLEPETAGVIMVLTKELAEHLSSDATNVINSELRAAVAHVVDATFWDNVIDGDTPTFTSAGMDADDMRRDLHVLLAAVNTSGVGPLLWAMSPDVANQAALIGDTKLPGMTPLGGTLLGLPAMVSSAVPAATLRLVNAAALGGNVEPLELDASNETSLEMDDNPSMAGDSPVTESTVISMWQTNSVALAAKVRFAVKRMRDNAVAELTGIHWLGTT